MPSGHLPGNADRARSDVWTAGKLPLRTVQYKGEVHGDLPRLSIGVHFCRCHVAPDRHITAPDEVSGRVLARIQLMVLLSAITVVSLVIAMETFKSKIDAEETSEVKTKESATYNVTV